MKTTEMKNKKFVTLALIFAVALLVFAACSKDAADGYPSTISDGSAGEVMPTPAVGGDNFGWADANEPFISASDEERYFSTDSNDEDNAFPVPPPAARPETESELTEQNRREVYVSENAFVNTRQETAVTFTMQMDTASYGNISRYINSGNRPPEDVVRVAEMVNYFSYDMELPTNDSPFSVYTEIGASPFNDGNYLAFVRVRAQDIDRRELPGNNLTFLIDISGSMSPADRLPLLQQSLAILVETLGERDVISVVTYASGSSVVLNGVRGDRQNEIMNAINGLRAGGSTAGADGIQTAYRLAMENYNPDMNNRIILCTDGDFNVGVSSDRELEDLMNEQRRNGIYMTILGFGMGNYRDTTMETIARNGNGTYHYINTIQNARKIFIEDLTSNLYIIAEEVRAQVVFNENSVASYRLIGYENRLMDNQDFDNDARDAGEVGVGADLVIMFEIRLQENARTNDELFTVRIRYKNPGEYNSRLIEIPAGTERILTRNTNDFNFAAAVATFGHILRNSEFNANATIADVFALANDALGMDVHGHRREFIRMVEQYQRNS